MNWKEFNDLTRTYLLVDAERKGRGIQKYIDQLIIAGVKNLQEYISAFRDRNVNVYFENDLTEVTAGRNSVSKEFNPINAELEEVIVSGLVSEDGEERWFLGVQVVPWSNRFLVINGCPARTNNYAGKITFGDGRFYLCAPLVDNQKLYIYWKGIKDTYDDDDLVIFDDMTAKAVADYVKAHLNREVDKDVNLYKSYLEMYSKQRQELHIKWKDYNHTTAVDHADGTDTTTGIGGFVIG